jgi:hypothetical protein
MPSHCGKRVVPLLLVSSEKESSAALEASALSYLAAHYIGGVTSVFAVQPSDNFVVQIVSNKYNPSNFWFVVISLIPRCLLDS